MSNLIGHVASVCIGVLGENLNKQPRQTIDAKLDGFVGDRHASFQREAWGAGDKQDGGVMRRNERQWSAHGFGRAADSRLPRRESVFCWRAQSVAPAEG
ncbi:hypothetical protein N9R09_00585 [Porticoccaceae bacterium]|nr:hypothetical protein [Porticoccaceae bacterium]